MPTLDVVVPCYNYGRFLERCVNSVLTQEGVDVRVLIIDDCSSDNSPSVGRKLADNDPRVEFRRHEKNLGHIATYNEGLIGWAQADYALLLSADDALAPGAFARAFALFETSNDIGFVYGLARIITHDDAFAPASERIQAPMQVMAGRDFLRAVCEHCSNPVPTASAIVRTNLQKQLGGYRSDLPHTGDLEMWMRFAKHGSVGVVGSVQADYRRHPTNMSNQYYAEALNDRQAFEKTCVDALQPILSSEPDAQEWLAAMRKNLVRHAYMSAVVMFDCGETDAYAAWMAFASRLSGFGSKVPQQPLRLTARRLLGQRVWLGLRAIRKMLNPKLPAPQIFNQGWIPVHGDVIGDWPASIKDKA